MKSLYLNMFKKINYIAAILVLLTGMRVSAQVTSQSPYSKYGLGNVKGLVLPQFRAMGGISTGVYKPSGYSNVNMQNPASYPGITLTTLETGLSGGFSTLDDGSKKESSFNASLGHIALAFPIVRGKSGLSFGLMPYTQVGYKYSKSSVVDTMNATSLYSGEGGLTKAYFGFGQQFFGRLRLGANVEYLFGNLIENSASELLDPSYSMGNIKIQNKNSVGGVSFSYGAQYDIRLGSKKSITLGYSGSSASTVNSKKTFVATQYGRDSNGDEGSASETIDLIEDKDTDLKLPLVHNFGFTFQKENAWLIGADYRKGNWSKLTLDGVNQGLQDSWGYSAGLQITPDYSSIGSYFQRVDYRIGYTYDKTYIRLQNHNINQKAITFGLGLPMASTMNSVYKINVTAEVGQRGTLTNNLVKENFVNIHLGFTLNDTWFRRYRLN